MRKAFGKTIAEIVNKDKQHYVLMCDIGYGVFDELQENNPDHLINTGITEAATIGMASGMAMEGLKPWVYTITPFLLERPFEQIKIDIVGQKQNVKLVSYFDYDIMGTTHRTNDVAGICKILKIEMITPKSYRETVEVINTISRDDKAYFIYLIKAEKE